ncbi:MAG: hypothetical protein ACREJO_15070 [Phycisphaerales bacterium]
MGDRAATTFLRTLGERAFTGRKRWLAGWVLLVIGVAITSMWFASRWWMFRYGGHTWGLYLYCGTVSVSAQPWRPAAEFRVRSAPTPSPGWKWTLDGEEGDSFGRPLYSRVYGSIAGLRWVSYGTTSARTWEVCLWAPAAAAMLAGCSLLWSAQRARSRRTGTCWRCGYDLAGLAAGASCPECGGGAKVVH